jgi:hypothetical protein
MSLLRVAESAPPSADITCTYRRHVNQVQGKQTRSLTSTRVHWIETHLEVVGKRSGPERVQNGGPASHGRINARSCAVPDGHGSPVEASRISTIAR